MKTVTEDRRASHRLVDGDLYLELGRIPQGKVKSDDLPDVLEIDGYVVSFRPRTDL